MKKILFLLLLGFSYSGLVAQVEVCESKDYDMSAIDKCIIEEENTSYKNELKKLNTSLVLRKKIVKKNNHTKVKESKISKELISKIILQEKVQLTVVNNK